MYSKGIMFLRKLDQLCGFQREFIIKGELETDEKYGYYPIERPIEEYIKQGVINLDKPPGPTSHEVVAWIKRMFNLLKAGHGGTLEPLTLRVPLQSTFIGLGAGKS